LPRASAVQDDRGKHACSLPTCSLAEEILLASTNLLQSCRPVQQRWAPKLAFSPPEETEPDEWLRSALLLDTATSLGWRPTLPPRAAALWPGQFPCARRTAWPGSDELKLPTSPAAWFPEIRISVDFFGAPPWAR
jgi:hypothetical protein